MVIIGALLRNLQELHVLYFDCLLKMHNLLGLISVSVLLKH
jgi:hypothetical protein